MSKSCHWESGNSQQPWATPSSSGGLNQEQEIKPSSIPAESGTNFSAMPGQKDMLLLERCGGGVLLLKG